MTPEDIIDVLQKQDRMLKHWQDMHASAMDSIMEYRQVIAQHKLEITNLNRVLRLKNQKIKRLTEALKQYGTKDAHTPGLSNEEKLSRARLFMAINSLPKISESSDSNIKTQN